MQALVKHKTIQEPIIPFIWPATPDQAILSPESPTPTTTTPMTSIPSITPQEEAYKASHIPSFSVGGNIRPRQASRLNVEDNLDIIQWCLEHREDYTTLAKAVFWHNCSIWIEAMLFKSIREPRRTVERLVRNRKQEVHRASRREFADTSLNQALNRCIEFLDDQERITRSGVKARNRDREIQRVRLAREEERLVTTLRQRGNQTSGITGNEAIPNEVRVRRPHQVRGREEAIKEAFETLGGVMARSLATLRGPGDSGGPELASWMAKQEE